MKKQKKRISKRIVVYCASLICFYIFAVIVFPVDQDNRLLLPTWYTLSFVCIPIIIAVFYDKIHISNLKMILKAKCAPDSGAPEIVTPVPAVRDPAEPTVNDVYKAVKETTQTLKSMTAPVSVARETVAGQTANTEQNQTSQNITSASPPPYVEPPTSILTAPYSQDTLTLREAFESNAFKKASSTSFVVGRDLAGNIVTADIINLPHLLIFGSTGTGKSTLLDSIILSMVFKCKPSELRIMLMDASSAQLSVYNGFPHLLLPVIHTENSMRSSLQWITTEISRRFKCLAEAERRNITEFNDFAWENYRDELSRILVIIDGITVSFLEDKDVQSNLTQIAQQGHKVGIHLIVSSSIIVKQKSLSNLMTFIPARAAFNLVTIADSRYVLGMTGAENLDACGDAFFKTKSGSHPIRVKTCISSFYDISNVKEYLRAENLISDYTKKGDSTEIKENKEDATEAKENKDELIPAAVEVILETGQASVSVLQRRLKLGYARAARILDQMEELGIVGPFEGSSPRRLLITREQWQKMRQQY